MKIVFMGTPDFSVHTLKHLIGQGHEVSLVVSQPDRPRGRGKKPSFSPVKECALEFGIPCYQPERIRDEECREVLARENADVFVVVAFGQILPQRILDLPKYGCLNVHASLLPKYRGAAPIQWAVINGDKETGVTIMQMDAGMDTGDILMQETVALDADETGGSLFDKLAESGSVLCGKTIRALEAGTVRPVPQDDASATYTRMIQKQDGKIDFEMPANRIECLIRGMNPWPSAYTSLHGKTFKIWEAQVTDEQTDSEPGTIYRVTKDAFCVACKNGGLKILSVQLEGKRRMSAADFLRGYSLSPGERLV